MKMNLKMTIEEVSLEQFVFDKCLKDKDKDKEYFIFLSKIWHVYISINKVTITSVKHIWLHFLTSNFTYKTDLRNDNK